MFDLAGSAQCVGAHFGQSDVLDFARLFELLELLDRFLDGRDLVNAVDIKEIDARQSETCEALVDRSTSVLRRGIDLLCGVIEGELGCDEDLVTRAGVTLCRMVSMEDIILRQTVDILSHFPISSSLSPYKAAVSQNNSPDAYALSRTVKRSSSDFGVP